MCGGLAALLLWLPVGCQQHKHLASDRLWPLQTYLPTHCLPPLFLVLSGWRQAGSALCWPCCLPEVTAAGSGAACAAGRDRLCVPAQLGPVSQQPCKSLLGHLGLGPLLDLMVLLPVSQPGQLCCSPLPAVLCLPRMGPG